MTKLTKKEIKSIKTLLVHEEFEFVKQGLLLLQVSMQEDIRLYDQFLQGAFDSKEFLVTFERISVFLEQTRLKSCPHYLYIRVWLIAELSYLSGLTCETLLVQGAKGRDSFPYLPENFDTLKPTLKMIVFKDVDIDLLELVGFPVLTDVVAMTSNRIKSYKIDDLPKLKNLHIHGTAQVLDNIPERYRECFPKFAPFVVLD